MFSVYHSSQFHESPFAIPAYGVLLTSRRRLSLLKMITKSNLQLAKYTFKDIISFFD
jgi:hypothetical protein